MIKLDNEDLKEIRKLYSSKLKAFDELQLVNRIVLQTEKEMWSKFSEKYNLDQNKNYQIEKKDETYTIELIK